EHAASSLRAFLERELPVCDETLPAEAPATGRALPRGLRHACGRWFSGSVVCPGIGKGRVVMLGSAQLPPELLERPAEAPADERERLRRASLALRAALEMRLASRPQQV